MQPFAEWCRRVQILACLTLVLAHCLAAQSVAPVITVEHGLNAEPQQAKPYVVMVSLDGFRYDYAKKYGAKHLLALGAQGAAAPQGMIPSYPSLTFPNHYTLVTGLYPEHHGIVANSFYDPARKQRYSFADPATNTDGSWYGGTPLWVLAEKQGMRSACFYWPGSEAEIAGMRPTYYLKFDDHFPDEQADPAGHRLAAHAGRAAAALHHSLLLDGRSCRASIRAGQSTDSRRGCACRSVDG